MKKQNKESLINVPDDIRLLFGKFYVFSFILIIFLSIIYPFFIMSKISLLSRIGILLFLLVFYIVVVIDLFKKKKSFSSSILVLLIILVGVSFSISVVKLFI